MRSHLYRIYSIFFRIKRKIIFILYKFLIIPIFKNDIDIFSNKLHEKNILDTIKELLNTNKSLGRFGDGELRWALGNKSNYMSFEKNSSLLSKDLLKVLNNNNKKFMIGLPDAFISMRSFTKSSRLFWEIFILKYGKKIFPYLYRNKVYYDTSVTRPYIDYNTRKIACKTFNMFKQLWKNKNILIVEGNESRVGVSDDLFNSASTISRIECPVRNAFESYNFILKDVIKFLKRSTKQFLILISLGPTATVISYDLCIRGYRAIDIGHLDVEYQWYLIGAKDKINLPYQYINENYKGHSVLPVKNRKYYNEIIKIIR